MWQQMRIQILILGFKWLKYSRQILPLRGSVLQGGTMKHAGGCDNCFDATDPFNY